jgi:hypothetical protein
MAGKNEQVGEGQLNCKDKGNYQQIDGDEAPNLDMDTNPKAKLNASGNLKKSKERKY